MTRGEGERVGEEERRVPNGGHRGVEDCAERCTYHAILRAFFALGLGACEFLRRQSSLLLLKPALLLGRRLVASPHALPLLLLRQRLTEATKVIKVLLLRLHRQLLQHLCQLSAEGWGSKGWCQWERGERWSTGRAR